MSRKKSIVRNINFKEDNNPSGKEPALSTSKNNFGSTDSLLPEQLNISQEIFRMIPVRGPTLFEKQFHEFVHGVQSKSGNPVMK